MNREDVNLNRTDLSSFKALTVHREGSFELDMNPDIAFPLFTALGEKLWISTWEPFVLHGNGYDEGTIWVTEDEGHRAYWYVAIYDTEKRNARYVRVTPEVNSGTVDVCVSSNGSEGTMVTVIYQLTGLSETGNGQTARMLDEDAYARMMGEWRDMIIQNRDQIDSLTS